MNACIRLYVVREVGVELNYGKELKVHMDPNDESAFKRQRPGNYHPTAGAVAHPQYLDLEQARQLLAEMNVRLTPRQIKRSSDMDAQGKRKLPWFIDPIEGRLKIERSALLSVYFNRQVEAERNCDN